MLVHRAISMLAGSCALLSVGLLQAPAAATRSLAVGLAGTENVDGQANAPARLAQRQCSQRFGPFIQETAWARWRQARAQGYAVSNGVVPCYDGPTRGYCFFVFYRC